MGADICNTLLLRDYSSIVAETDKLPQHELLPVLYGLYGEVGSILTAAKKYYRESEVYTGYSAALEEEFGDTIWYLAALCRRVGVSLDEAFGTHSEHGRTLVAATDLGVGPVATVRVTDVNGEIGPKLLKLAKEAANLLVLASSQDRATDRIREFAEIYIATLQAVRLSFARVLHANIGKVQGRFLKADVASLPTFNLSFPSDEQLPQNFEIEIVERANGRSHLRWNGVFLGDPLSDNILDRDGYRFHDVFHFAHASVLHWSPVFRALIKHKRKSDPEVDEAQDGGRAIVVEEGLTAWVFSRAKKLNFFEDQQSLSFDLLKTLREFVAGYEIDRCPLQLWEDAILQGYEAFRQIRKAKHGIVIGDRQKRSLTYKPLR
jgi:hypothetical protein